MHVEIDPVASQAARPMPASFTVPVKPRPTENRGIREVSNPRTGTNNYQTSRFFSEVAVVPVSRAHRFHGFLTKPEKASAWAAIRVGKPRGRLPNSRVATISSTVPASSQAARHPFGGEFTNRQNVAQKPPRAIIGTIWAPVRGCSAPHKYRRRPTNLSFRCPFGTRSLDLTNPGGYSRALSPTWRSAQHSGDQSARRTRESRRP